MKYLYILQQALIWIITIFWLYQIVVSMCSLVKLKDKPLLTNKKHKFMAIIPAHNEESVVANLVESLKNQEYPKELLDIYVIADNCTDNTVKIARKAGATVLERYEDDPEKKTKGYYQKLSIRFGYLTYQIRCMVKTIVEEQICLNIPENERKQSG